MVPFNILVLFAGAVCIGFVSAISGIGGGSLIVPFLVLVLNYDIRVAIAISLLCIVISSSSATSIYLRRNLVSLETALLLEPATVLGAIVGANLTLTLPVKIVKCAFGILLLWIAIIMFRRALKSTLHQHSARNIPHRRIVAVLISFLAGLLSGMFGIGGGILKVPLMTFILGLPIKTAVATSSFMIGLTATSGGIVYLIKGFVNPVPLVILALGLIPGATLGAKLMRKLKPEIIRLIFSLILLYASLRLIYSIVV